MRLVEQRGGPWIEAPCLLALLRCISSTLVEISSEQASAPVHIGIPSGCRDIMEDVLYILDVKMTFVQIVLTML